MGEETVVNQKEIIYQELVSKSTDEILERKRKFAETESRPFLVTMTGDSGSGKSFYSEKIRQKLDKRGENYTYINADDFLISRADREPMKSDFYADGEFAGKSKWHVLENMFRLDLLQKVIDAMKAGQSVSYEPYERATGEVALAKKTVEPAGLIIFDSSMLYDQMDMILMVDVDLEEIIKRKVARDGDIRTPEEVEKMHREVQGYYWDRKKPQQPDVVIDNNDFDAPKLKIRDKS